MTHEDALAIESAVEGLGDYWFCTNLALIFLLLFKDMSGK